MDSTVFMVFGLGFFLFVIQMISRDHSATYLRELNEKREFGVHPVAANSRKFFRRK